jgi:hypothetical protein
MADKRHFLVEGDINLSEEPGKQAFVTGDCA